MRIVAGEFGGRILKTPKDSDIRPTSDKVRQAVFNMLHSRGAVEGANVLDAFCGTGALGLEALSQGAAFCTFIDVSKKSLLLCKENIDALGVGERCAGLVMDSTKLADKPKDIPQANLVFLDPPYNKDLVPRAIEALHLSFWLAEDAVLVIETAQKEDPDLQGLEVLQEKTYGDTRIILAHKISA